MLNTVNIASLIWELGLIASMNREFLLDVLADSDRLFVEVHAWAQHPYLKRPILGVEDDRVAVFSERCIAES